MKSSELILLKIFTLNYKKNTFLNNKIKFNILIVNFDDF